MFRDTIVSYPEDKMVLGRDFGPALDIGMAMTRKILKKNGIIVYRSTVRPLTPDEMADPVQSVNVKSLTPWLPQHLVRH